MYITTTTNHVHDRGMGTLWNLAMVNVPADRVFLISCAPTSIGLKGSFTNHVLAARHALEQGFTRALVLEDDATP